MLLPVVFRSLVKPNAIKLIGTQSRFFRTHYRSGAIKPMPMSTPHGYFGVFCVVIPGLFLGAAISKAIANFLEENELFVPSDDDDDDD